MNFIIKKLHFLICAVLIMAMMTGTVQAAYGSSFAGGGRTAGKYTISLYDRNGVMTQQVLKKRGLLLHCLPEKIQREKLSWGGLCHGKRQYRPIRQEKKFLSGKT